MPLPVKEVFGPGGVGEAFDGAVGHLELAADGAATVAGIQHRVDGGVPGPDAVGEPVAFPGRRQGLFGRCGLLALFPVTGWFGSQDAQALAVTGDGPLGGLAEVVPQVPPVGNLSRLGCPGRGAFGEERSPIPADHLDAGPFGQPLCQAGCLPVRQQVHWPSGFDIDQNRAVDAALARGVLIDADHSRGRCLRIR